MEDGLGGLGFWLMIGMIGAATIVSEGIKERDKERDRQATLRALLEKDQKTVTEVLAYMRERDAAKDVEAARERAADGKWWRVLAALAVGILAFVAGLVAFAAVRRPLYGGGPESVLIPLVPMLAVWVAGLYIARRTWRSVKQKNDAQPDA